MFPKPKTGQNEWKITKCSNSVDEAQPKATEQKTSSDLAVTPEPVDTAGLPVISLEQECSNSVDEAQPEATEQKTSSDLAVTLEPVGTAGLPVISLEQKPEIEIGRISGGGSSGRPAAATPQLKPGDIIVLDTYEYLRVKAGGVAMMLILYKLYQPKTGQ
ncbi:hypothetical protein NW767_011342 [Fusarium falciforme]|nr:hypothetical protein NW767_011342 [Fusarium falciforme]